MERKPLINLILSSTLLATGSIAGFTDLALAKNTITVLEEQPLIDANTATAKLDKKPNLTANAPISTKTPKSSKQTANYLPYLQVEGSRLFHTANSKAAVGTDLFIPLWQDRSNLIFTDLRTYNPSGKSFEGNAHFGYRHLSPDETRLYGLYGSFDRRRTSLGNYFNQLTLGGECWINHWFIGGNIYQPIGKNSKTVTHSALDNGLWLTTNRSQEKAAPGVDAEVGYDLTNSMTAYAGGYYYKGKDIGTKYGPKARITYDFSLDNGRILGVFDKIGIEAGIQHDRPLGTVWYLSTNVRIGWLPKNKADLQGVARHMVDPVRRDANIITLTNNTTEVTPSPTTTTTLTSPPPSGPSDTGGGNSNLSPAPEPLISPPSAPQQPTEITIIKEEPLQAAASSTQKKTDKNNGENDSWLKRVFS